MEIFALISLIIAYLLKLIYPKIKGQVGEYRVNKELSKLGNEYIVLNDLMIFSDNKTHQIDHAIVSKYGIFVIETKNYSGKIVGKINDKEWTQYIGKKANKMKNPIIQNHGHILALKDITKEKENNFIPIVCFHDEVELKVESSRAIVKFSNLNKKIKEYKEVKIKNKDNIVEIIKNNNIIDKNKRKEHVKNIKKKYK